MKVLLVAPPKRRQVWAGVPDIFNDKNAYVFPHLGLLYLSSFIKQNTTHEVHVVDCVAEDLSAEQIRARFQELAPDVVGLLAKTHNLIEMHDVARIAKGVNPKIHVLIGGPHTKAFPEEAIALTHVDAIARGDGEHTLADWLSALESGSGFDQVKGIWYKDGAEVRKNADREPLHNLDEMPFPDRGAVDVSRYYTPGMKQARTTTMISSRGCPYSCSFCNVPKGYRARSAANIVDEMLDCSARFGVQEVHFVDDLFNITAKRVIEISEEMIRRKSKVKWGFKGACTQTTKEMLLAAKEAGCVKAHFGVETYTPEGLKALSKPSSLDQMFDAFRWTREAGLKSVAYMIVGSPHEKTREDILGVRSFIRKLDPDFVVYSLYTPYPDAPVFQKGVDLGLWPADVWTRFMRNPVEDYDLPTAWTQYLTKKELLDIFKIVHRDFYYNPRVLFRTLLSIENTADLTRILKGGLQLFRMEFLKPDVRRI